MGEKSFFTEILRIFKRNKKFILFFNSAILVISVIILLLLPKWYVGRATVLITSQSNFNPLASLNNFLPGNLLSFSNTNKDQYFILAGSHTIMDRMIQKFRLDTLYEVKYPEDIYAALKDDISLIENEDGSLTIECYYKENPVVAAEMANYLFQQIKELSLEIANKQAREYRMFIESVYNRTLDELKQYEDSLKTFQEQSNLYDVEEQTKQIIEIIASLETQKVGLEAEKAFLEKIQSPGSQSVSQLREKISALEAQINRIETSNYYTGVALKDLPSTGLEYFRIYRNLKMKEKILEFIVPQLEQAKLEEQKNTIEIFLLDKAVPQGRKARPQRSKILVIIMLMSLMFTYIILKTKELYKILQKKYADL